LKVRGIERPLGLSRNTVVVGEPVAGLYAFFKPFINLNLINIKKKYYIITQCFNKKVLLNSL
jgi:hypothetical protein